MDTSTATTRRPTCFFNKNDEIHNTLINSTPLYLPRRTSLKNLSSSSLIMSSPRSVCVRRLYNTSFEDPQPHFLDSCFLCKKPLGQNRDIFMYRGDTPFCSEECRQEQIEMDETNEKKLKLSALRKKDQKKSTSSNKTQNFPFSRGTVAAA